ncbi:MAG TPA: transglycosylase domain-containing protein [Steroidobacteraceae bacterium]|nr:transglycosylase domain-containing protein [Steroidobacteraceae bacterium]
MKVSPVRALAAVILGVLSVALLAAYALMASYVYLLPSLPTVDAMRTGALAAPLRVYTRSGELIGEIGAKRRLPVAYNDIPVLVREAFVAAEDERFFEHHGFDYSGVLRAAWVDLMSGDFSQGASTITMQAARNMFLNFDKTIRRKLQEIFLTYRMEHEFTKDQILDTYLNVIFLGQRSYGVAAAAQTYFGKQLDELTVAEAATLAGIPQAPSRYNPIINPRATKARRRYVLGQMLKLGDIDAATAAHAAEEPVKARDYGILYDVEAPYVAEMARADLVSRYGDDAVNAGYKVYTTIDGRLQTAANHAVRLGLIEYAARHGYEGPLRHTAIGPRASSGQLNAALAGVPVIGDLQPAVVVSVASRAARVYVRSVGYARIDWDGLSWARRRLPDMGLGPAPQRAADVVQAGDVVYVVANDSGVAQLAQLPQAQGALVALDPNDGAVAALVGGFDYYANKFNRVTQARRQPGSGFKPFLYSCALDHGFTPATIVLDAPIIYDDTTGQEKIWRPKNDENSFDGPMRLREGLVHSLNFMTIRVVRQLGIDTASQCAAKFGFDPQAMPKDLTLALGSLTVTPMQMVSAYAVFANGGYRVNPYFIDRIEDASGKVVYQAAPKVVCARCDSAAANPGAAPNAAVATPAAATTGTAGTATSAAAPPAAAIAAAGAAAAVPIGLASAANPAAAGGPSAGSPADPNLAPASVAPPLLPPDRIAPRVISPQNAWLMDDMMADVIRRGTGERAWLALRRNDISGKTGTTNDERHGTPDTWFNGFNRNIVASVWVGFDDERPLGAGEQGSRTAVPIWVSFMREALRAQPDQPRPLPPGLVTERISSRTGQLAAPNDPDAMYETFMADHLPSTPESGITVPGTTQAPGGEPLF